MTTLMEKLGKKLEEGMEAARLGIRSKVGESQMLCPPGSIYYLDLRDRARVLEARVDQIEADIDEFLSISSWSAKEGKAGEQMDLEVEGEKEGEKEKPQL